MNCFVIFRSFPGVPEPVLDAVVFSAKPNFDILSAVTDYASERKLVVEFTENICGHTLNATSSDGTNKYKIQARKADFMTA